MSEDPFQAFMDAGFPEQEASRLAALVAERLKGGIDPGLPLSVSEMEAMARITDADVQVARVDWYASDAVPAAFKRLLDAREL